MEERKKCAFSFEHRVLLLLLLLLLLMMMMMMTMMSVAMVTRWLSWQRGVRWCSCEVDKIPARRPHTHRHTPDTGRHTITTTGYYYTRTHNYYDTNCRQRQSTGAQRCTESRGQIISCSTGPFFIIPHLYFAGKATNSSNTKKRKTYLTKINKPCSRLSTVRG